MLATRAKDAAAYTSHLLGVTGLVLEAAATEDLAILRFAEDMVEDCGGAPMLERCMHALNGE
jgi:hypothetical protein